MGQQQFSKLEVRLLASHVGAEIRGVDPAARHDDATIAQIRAALLEWKVVFFRNQKISHAEQIGFASRFGTSHLGPQDVDHIERERKLHRITLVGDIPVGVDGVPSKALKGEPLLAAVS
jgi:taurine dioxygenase